MPDKQPGRAAKALFGIHATLYRVSGGTLGHRLSPSMRCLLLTTQGARSGIERVSPLLYGRDGSRVVLIASQGGSTRNPPWYHNLRAHPEVTVQIGRRRLSLVATVVADEPERSRLWAIMVAAYGGYERYQRDTTRRIPVIVLEPRTTGAVTA